MSEAWHVGTSRVRLGVVDLAKGVLLDRLRIATQLAEMVQAWSNVAESYFLFSQLMTRIAIAARRSRWIITELLAHTGLRDFLAFFPVAQQFAVSRKFHQFHVDGFDLAGNFFRTLVRVLGTKPLRFVLIQSVHFGHSGSRCSG